MQLAFTETLYFSRINSLINACWTDKLSQGFIRETMTHSTTYCKNPTKDNLKRKKNMLRVLFHVFSTFSISLFFRLLEKLDKVTIEFLYNGSGSVGTKFK